MEEEVEVSVEVAVIVCGPTSLTDAKTKDVTCRACDEPLVVSRYLVQQVIDDGQVPTYSCVACSLPTLFSDDSEMAPIKGRQKEELTELFGEEELQRVANWLGLKVAEE
jgi:hypothetical protein